MPTSALLRAAHRTADEMPGWHSSNSTSSAPLLDVKSFAALVAAAPLVSIDLIVEDQHGAVLLGMRTNPPAQGSWFVPGGRIHKNETMERAFARITLEEIGLGLSKSKAQMLDVYEHFYQTDFAGTPGATTHYIVLAHRIIVARETLSLPREQHSRYEWMQPAQAARHPDVHPYSRAYFAD
jgi:colanic acid biosynthesis protein WcaH